jgi:tetratricopeptide (TPR) repeat protein
VNPCPFGGGPGEISVCTQTLQDPRLLPEDKPYALWARGRANYDASQYVAALADFDAAIKFMPSIIPDPARDLYPAGSETHDQDWDLMYPFGEFFNGRAQALMHLGRFDEAVAAAVQAEATFHSKARAAGARAIQAEIKLRMGKAGEAERLYRQAAELDTTWSEPLYDLALLKLVGGENDSVGAVLEEAVGRDPISREPAILLVALNLSSPEKTKELLPREEDWDVLGSDKAIAEYFAGRIDLAALMKRPDGMEAHGDRYRLCEIHFFLGVAAISIDKAAAIDHFEAAVATDADHSMEYLASQLFLKKLNDN